jgi:hypothetical protein
LKGKNLAASLRYPRPRETKKLTRPPPLIRTVYRGLATTPTVWLETVLFTGTYRDLDKLCKPMMHSTEQWLNIWKVNRDEKSFAVDTAHKHDLIGVLLQHLSCSIRDNLASTVQLPFMQAKFDKESRVLTSINERGNQHVEIDTLSVHKQPLETMKLPVPTKAIREKHPQDPSPPGRGWLPAVQLRL